jgi:hypothetical protein
MNVQEIINQARSLQKRLPGYAARDSDSSRRVVGARAQVCEFLRNYAGPKSAFLKYAEEVDGNSTMILAALVAIIDSFLQYFEAGLAMGLSPERQAQLDVVSEILGQAQSLLDDDRHHPAAAAVLVGASLEEFLRTWVETEGLSIGNAKPGLDAYTKALRTEELITKQDVKDITSWAGIRNHAAHGEWDEVSDRSRIRLMLEGVNLFMRQKQKS